MNEQKRDALAEALRNKTSLERVDRREVVEALLPLIDTWLAEAERQGARRELHRVADGIESQSPEMSFTDANLYFRFADYLRGRAKAITEETR